MNKVEYRIIVSIYLSGGMQLTHYLNEDTIEELHIKREEKLKDLKEQYEDTLELVIFRDVEKITTEVIEQSNHSYKLAELTNSQIPKDWIKKYKGEVSN